MSANILWNSKFENGPGPPQKGTRGVGLGHIIQPNGSHIIPVLPDGCTCMPQVHMVSAYPAGVLIRQHDGSPRDYDTQSSKYDNKVFILPV